MVELKKTIDGTCHMVFLDDVDLREWDEESREEVEKRLKSGDSAFYYINSFKPCGCPHCEGHDCPNSTSVDSCGGIEAGSAEEALDHYLKYISV